MKLAINGGEPIRKKLFSAQRDVGKEEIKAIKKFWKKKNRVLSGFRGSNVDAFWGGEQVQNLEVEFKKYTGLRGLAVNSCTSALIIACGAIGLKTGDEVIVTPWSMSCSATAPMWYGAKPVFADIEHDYFCLDPESVESKITNKTKAIIVVDLFGQAFSEKIIEIAKRYNLYIIEDAAQAIGATRHARPCGTLGDIGCFSFTQGKHLTAGEGGMIICHDHKLYQNCALLRNHAESVIHDFPEKSKEKLKHMVGMNLRMTEIQAVILQEQLKKLESYIAYRQKNGEYFNSVLGEIDFIQPCEIRPYATHSYYVLPYFFDAEKAGIHRDKFIAAVKAELQPDEQRIDRGVPIGCGYIEPLYRFPVFKNKFKPKDFPIVENLWKNELFITLYHGLDLKQKDREDITNAFYKVVENIRELK